jgi:hypothetical protein
VWAYVEVNASERAVRVRERAPSIVERLPKGSGRKDDVGLLGGAGRIGLGCH